MKKNLKICTGPSCCRNHGNELLKNAKKSAKTTDTKITETTCMGYCINAPCIELNGKLITEVSPAEIGKLLGDTSPQTKTNPNLEDAKLESIDDLLGL